MGRVHLGPRNWPACYARVVHCFGYIWGCGPVTDFGFRCGSGDIGLRLRCESLIKHRDPIATADSNLRLRGKSVVKYACQPPYVVRRQGQVDNRQGARSHVLKPRRVEPLAKMLHSLRRKVRRDIEKRDANIRMRYDEVRILPPRRRSI
jgi:hypothetical protein